MCLLLYTLDDPPSIAQQPGVPKVVVGPNDLWTALRWLWLHRPVGANKLEGQTLVDRLLEAPELNWLRNRARASPGSLPVILPLRTGLGRTFAKVTADISLGAGIGLVIAGPVSQVQLVDLFKRPL